MNLLKGRIIPVRIALGLTVGVVLALTWLGGRVGRPTRPPLEKWNVADLVKHLDQEGVDLHLAPTGANHSVGQGAFLTTTPRNWKEFNQLLKQREVVHHWQGAVYCERLRTRAAREEQISDWRDCCLVAGPFVFFGDRVLLARIRDALHLPGRGGAMQLAQRGGTGAGRPDDTLVVDARR